MRKIIENDDAGPITDANQNQDTGRSVLNVPRHEIICCDSIQQAAEIALGQVI